MKRAEGLAVGLEVGEDRTGLGTGGLQNFGFLFLAWPVVELVLLDSAFEFFHICFAPLLRSFA